MAAPPLPPVRLRPEEIAAVKRIVAEHFGPEAEVRVFGSRARLDQRGGDLDLHVRVPGEAPGPHVEGSAADAIQRALDDLQEVRAIEHEQPSDPFEGVHFPRRAVDRLQFGSVEIEPCKAGVCQRFQGHRRALRP